MSKINSIKIKQEKDYSEAIALGVQKYNSSNDVAGDPSENITLFSYNTMYPAEEACYNITQEPTRDGNKISFTLTVNANSTRNLYQTGSINITYPSPAFLTGAKCKITITSEAGFDPISKFSLYEQSRTSSNSEVDEIFSDDCKELQPASLATDGHTFIIERTVTGTGEGTWIPLGICNKEYSLSKWSEDAVLQFDFELGSSTKDDLYLSTKGSDKVFEPSLPGHPATKKYVDDQKGIIPVNPDNTDNINIWISDAE